MKAMIFAAGLGTRMRPLTDHTPKALVPVQNIPLLEIVIRRLIFFGIEDIIINVHYMAEQIEDFLLKNKNFGINIAISDEREKLLETGGGLKKAQWFFDDKKPFLVCNTDILCDINLEELMLQHAENQSIATLAVQKRNTSRYFLFDEKQNLSGWLNTKSGEVKLSKNESKKLQMLAFSSFQILETSIFDFMPKDTDVFSTVDLFLEISQKETIKGFEHHAQWLDVGTPQNIPQAELLLPFLLKK
jgi:NDP-sugar pyrophosphorylase family protein